MANKFTRCLWLINTLRTNGPMTFEDINRKWKQASWNDSEESLPKKTFHNYCEAVEELFGIRIACDLRGGYKYYLDYETQTDEWTSSLIDSLCMQVAVLSDPGMKNRLIDYNTLYAITDPRTLNIVFDAIRYRKSISFSLISEYYIEDFYPMFLIKIHQKWFTIGMFESPQSYQFVPFELLWIYKVQMNENSKRVEPPKEFNINEYLEYIMETDSKSTFGKYYTSERLTGYCSNTEKDMKKAIFDAKFLYLGSLEYLEVIPKGTALKAAEAYYERKLE